ncbi:MAG: acyl-CoA dehydrogenase family protein [Myxococcota bacterium]
MNDSNHPKSAQTGGISPAVTEALVENFAARAATHDADGSFVHGNYDDLLAKGIYGALVPEALGGLGCSYRDVADFVRRVGQACGSTALSLSMHSHLVAAAVWKLEHGKPTEPLLRKVAGGAVLISTGAGDWLGSNGTMERVEGGYRLNARKPFCSGSPRGTIFITTSVFADPDRGERVLHFPVAAQAPGVRLLDDWDTMGMRGTGSQTAVFEDVFVPETSIGLDRPRAGWHPAWNVVLTVAAPLYTAAYVGIAEAACDLARAAARKRAGEHTPYLLGDMENQLATCQMAHREMVANVAEFDFLPKLERTNATLIRKTVATNAARAAVDCAMEVAGGSSIARAKGLERHYRDVRAGAFHPLAEKAQTHFTGRVALGLSPIAD